MIRMIRMLHIVTVTHQETHDNVQSNVDDVIAGGSQGVQIVVQAERQHRERTIELHRSTTHEPKVEMAGCKEDSRVVQDVPGHQCR